MRVVAAGTRVWSGRAIPPPAGASRIAGIFEASNPFGAGSVSVKIVPDASSISRVKLHPPANVPVIRPKRAPLPDSEKPKKWGEPEKLYGNDAERAPVGSVYRCSELSCQYCASRRFPPAAKTVPSDDSSMCELANAIVPVDSKEEARSNRRMEPTAVAAAARPVGAPATENASPRARGGSPLVTASLSYTTPCSLPTAQWPDVSAVKA